jgi:cytidine deaminase
VSNGEQPPALREAALAAMERAYAPYSRFRVGAALAARDGQVFVGCNVENASYGAGVCAERAALIAAVACGARNFSRLVIVTEADEPTPPCGICRQVFAELAPDVVIISRTAAGAEASWTLAELLPHPFTAQSLDRS